MKIKNGQLANSLWIQFIKDRNNIQIKNKLVQLYYPMIRRIGSLMYKKMKGKVDREDLISYGLDGLYKSIMSYTLDKNTKFQTFAYQRISGSMIDVLRSQDWVPRSVRVRNNKVEIIKNQLSQKTLQYTSQQQIVKIAGFDGQSVFKRRNKFFITGVSSLDSTSGLDQQIQQVHDDQNQNLKSKESISQSNLVKNQFLQTLNRILSKQQLQIINLKYYQSKSLKQIQQFTKKQVKQINKIHRNAIKKMKELAKDNPEGYISKQSFQIFSGGMRY